MKPRLFVLFQLLFVIPVAGVSSNYSLPFQGRWFVMSGGDTLNVNHHMSERSQWYGIDLMKVGGPDQRSVVRKEPPEDVEDFYSWGALVLSPVDGVVFSVEDGHPDQPLGSSDNENPAGNFVVIQAKEDGYVFLAHFKKGSIKVEEGDSVLRGDILGLCGNSGRTTGPHIHMHVQDTPFLFNGTGLNVVFSGIDVELSGKHFGNVNWPLIRGLFISNDNERIQPR